MVFNGGWEFILTDKGVSTMFFPRAYTYEIETNENEDMHNIEIFQPSEVLKNELNFSIMTIKYNLSQPFFEINVSCWDDEDGTNPVNLLVNSFIDKDRENYVDCSKWEQEDEWYSRSKFHYVTEDDVRKVVTDIVDAFITTESLHVSPQTKEKLLTSINELQYRGQTSLTA
jgi:predicted nucleotide-binding protein (sugar kinase/HSP70/actin superfamily)